MCSTQQQIIWSLSRLYTCFCVLKMLLCFRCGDNNFFCVFFSFYRKVRNTRKEEKLWKFEEKFDIMQFKLFQHVFVLHPLLFFFQEKTSKLPRIRDALGIYKKKGLFTSSKHKMFEGGKKFFKKSKFMLDFNQLN